MKVVRTEVIDTEIIQRPVTYDTTSKQDFDSSARNFLDWIDSIERILDEKQSNEFDLIKRHEIVQEAKLKYISYDEQFKSLMQTGHTLTKQLEDGLNNITNLFIITFCSFSFLFSSRKCSRTSISIANS